ncbi:hypothetical protein NPIL_677871 [Nephila pilipes]|uniref:Uncharacterized protein n=1 Tax=Nephila pilipes TaxID=299642 RepID=A0A8X6PHX5_NEPPI|nr:hypothetical protein NPIL_677871 [Nephila pilipes]
MGLAHQVSLNQNVLLVKGKEQRNHGTFSSVILQSASCPSKQLATLEVTINGVIDRKKIEREVNTTCVKIRLGGPTLPLNLVAIPRMKNNITLLGMDFLESSGIVLNVKRKTWFFDDQPKRQFHFVEQFQESCDAVKLNVSETAAPWTEKETDHSDISHANEVNHLTCIPQLELKDHPDQLRER